MAIERTDDIVLCTIARDHPTLRNRRVWRQGVLDLGLDPVLMATDEAPCEDAGVDEVRRDGGTLLAFRGGGTLTIRERIGEVYEVLGEWRAEAGGGDSFDGY